MEVNELQELATNVVNLIDSKRKGTHDSDTTIMHIYEEIGEISRQLYGDKIGRSKIDTENLSEEISDCLILLFHLASVYNLDIEKELIKKVKSLGERHKELDWSKIVKNMKI